jgi:carboxypeptidase PM20D1
LPRRPWCRHSTHFAGLTNVTLRFRPLRMTASDLRRIHGTNERIAVDGYARMVKFYAQLVWNASSSALDDR